MDDFDLYESISRRPSKDDAALFLRTLKKEKQANAGRVALEAGKNLLANHSASLVGSVIGAAVAAGLQYRSNRKDPRTGVSKQVASAEKDLASHDSAQTDRQSQGRDATFLEEMGHSRAKSTAELSRLMQKHPGKGALLAAPRGAAIGALLAPAIASFAKNVAQGVTK